MTLSRPQLRALHQVRKRRLFTADVNGGNTHRTYASLFKLGLIDWDPICHGHVMLTAAGKEFLQKESAQKLVHNRPGLLRIKGVGDRRVITLTGVHKERS